MNEATAIYTVVIGLGALLGVMAPIVKLNNTITKLIATIEFINKENQRQDDRINNHSERINDLEKRVTKLEK